MKTNVGEWNGFKSETFEFKGKTATVIFPNNRTKNNPWLFKTEYLDAFPSFEIEMLNRGYFDVHIENETRWCLESDTERQIDFAKFIIERYDLSPKCVPVGMSCGGMQAVYLAAKAPELVAGLYIDAPVLNLLSCPCGIGMAADTLGGMYEEYLGATGITVSELINYRKHPIDFADKLIENKIPIFLVCGDSDDTVPYEENGKILYQKYVENGCPITQIVKKNCNHHPHGLEDLSPLVSFVLGL